MAVLFRNILDSAVWSVLHSEPSMVLGNTKTHETKYIWQRHVKKWRKGATKSKGRWILKIRLRISDHERRSI